MAQLRASRLLDPELHSTGPHPGGARVNSRAACTLVEARAREVSRVQKVLEGANIKLASVATDVLGKSGRAMLEALIAGEQDPTVLADLARGRMRVVSARAATGSGWATAETAPHPSSTSLGPHRLSPGVDCRAGNGDRPVPGPFWANGSAGPDPAGDC